MKNFIIDSEKRGREELRLCLDLSKILGGEVKVKRLKVCDGSK